MNGRAIRYSFDELAFVYLRRAMPRISLHAAFVAWFGRSDVSVAHLKALCKRRGWLTGRDGRFEKGVVPVNKGKPCAPGTGGRHPNARRTQFRKGERRGVVVSLYKPIGTERVSRDGYRERKIHDGLPWQSRWRTVHLIEWEKVNGPLPKGHALKCRDGDRANTDPANWEAIPRGVLPRLNGGRNRTRVAYDKAPDDLRPSIMAVAKLEHAARSRRPGA
jgi:hypothetical protein